MLAKKKIGSILLIIFLMGILTIGGYFLFNDHSMKKDKKTMVEKEKNSKKEENDFSDVNSDDKTDFSDVNSDEIQGLYYKITNAFMTFCGVDEYYKDVPVYASDISNMTAFLLAINQIRDDKIKQGQEEPFGIGVAFTVSELEQKIVNTFGKKYTFVNQTYSSCPEFVYREDKQEYVVLQPPGCGGYCLAFNSKKIVKVIRTDTTIELYVRVLFVDDESDQTFLSELDYYKDYKKTQKISDLEFDSKTKEILENDANFAKGSLYKLVFEKEDDQYPFISSTLVE